MQALALAFIVLAASFAPLAAGVLSRAPTSATTDPAPLAAMFLARHGYWVQVAQRQPGYAGGESSYDGMAWTTTVDGSGDVVTTAPPGSLPLSDEEMAAALGHLSGSPTVGIVEGGMIVPAGEVAVLPAPSGTADGTVIADTQVR